MKHKHREQYNNIIQMKNNVQSMPATRNVEAYIPRSLRKNKQRLFGNNSALWSRRVTRIVGNDSNKRPGASYTLQDLGNTPQTYVFEPNLVPEKVINSLSCMSSITLKALFRIFLIPLSVPVKFRRTTIQHGLQASRRSLCRR